MQVLLNATQAEVTRIGGDFTHYQALLELNTRIHGWGFNLLKYGDGLRSLHRFSGKFLHLTGAQCKVPLLLYSRQLPVADPDIRKTDANLIYSVVSVAQMPRRTAMPQVWYSQGISPSAYYDWYGAVTQQDVVTLYQRLAPRVTVIIIGTENCAQRLQELAGPLPCPVLVIPQLTWVPPLADLRLKDPDRLRFLFVGRDYRRKGLIEVLQAYKRIRSRYDELELCVVTKADASLRRAIAELKDVKLFSGLPRSDLLRLYEKSHVLVVPTHADTYNLTMVEAMAKGCAIISSNIEPLGEIAPDGEVGFLVPPGNVEALEYRMLTLIEDKSLRYQLSSASIARYRTHFAPDVVVPRLLEAFTLALNLGQ